MSARKCEDQESRDTIARLYRDERFRIGEIAVIFDTSMGTISRVIREMEVPSPFDTPEFHQAVIEFYDDGRQTIGAVGRAFGVSRNVARRILLAHNAPIKGGSRRALTPEQSAEVVRLYADGMTAHELAGRYHVHFNVIRDIAREAGVLRPWGGSRPRLLANPAKRAEIEACEFLYTGCGMSLDEVARETGIPAGTVRSRFLRVGVPIRSRGISQKRYWANLSPEQRERIREQRRADAIKGRADVAA